MGSSLLEFLRQRRSHILWGSAIAVIISIAASVYMLDFEHRYDERFQEKPNRRKGETEAHYKNRLTVDSSFYRRHYGWEFFENLELKLYDMRFRSRGTIEPLPEIVIVAIDTPSFQQVYAWPWPRHVYGEAIRRLLKAGVKLVAFDVLFSDPQSPKEDGQFRAAIKGANGKVILSGDFDEEIGEQKWEATPAFPIPELAEYAHDVGITRVPQDSDTFVRSFTAYMEHREPTTTGEAWVVYPSFVASVAGYLLGLTPEQIRSDLAHRHLGRIQIPFLPMRRDTERSLRAHAALTNYMGQARWFKTCSFFEVLDPKVHGDAELRELFKDKVVLIGASAAILHDVFPTPFMDNGVTPGIEIHANGIQTLLSRQFIYITTRATNLMVLLLMSLVTAVLTIVISKPVSSAATISDAKLSFSFRGYRVGFYGITWFLLYVGVGFFPPAFGYWVYAFRSFSRSNLWVPLFYPLGSMVLTHVACVVLMFLTEEQEKKKMHGRFQRFVAPTVLTEIMAHPTEEYPKPRRVEATLLFTDLQGFTTLSEAHEPEVVVNVLNQYMNRMANIIFKHKGTIDKYIGDAIMVIFGAPVHLPDHAAQAIQAAVEMQEECARFREYGRSQGWPDFYMRVGVHTGKPMVGSIGAENRLDYTAIGDDVNLASRLEGLNKQYHSWIMCSSVTYELVKDLVVAEFVPAAQVKGKVQAVDVFKVYGLKETGRRDEFWGEGAGGKESEHSSAAPAAGEHPTTEK